MKLGKAFFKGIIQEPVGVLRDFYDGRHGMSLLPEVIRGSRERDRPVLLELVGSRCVPRWTPQKKAGRRASPEAPHPTGTREGTKRPHRRVGHLKTTPREGDTHIKERAVRNA